MTWFLALPRWIKFAGLGALLVVAASIYVQQREKAAVERDRAKAAAEATERNLRAQEAANRNSEAIRAANASEAAKTREAMKEAEDASPNEARRAAGPVTRAASERLRQRQAAKHAPTR